MLALTSGFFSPMVTSLQQGLASEFPILSRFPLPKAACVAELVSGAAVSLLTKNPLPMLIGASTCLPKVSAQVPVGDEFPVSDYMEVTKRSGLSTSSFSDGRVIAVWSVIPEYSGLDNVIGHVSGKLFSPLTGVMSGELRLNNNTDTYDEPTYVAVLPSGNFASMWFGDTGIGAGCIILRLFDSQGTPITDEIEVVCSTMANEGIIGVDLKALTNDHVVVKWHDGMRQSDARYVSFQLFNLLGARVGNVVKTCNSTSQEAGMYSSMVTLSNGNIVVACQIFDGASSIKYSMYDSIGTFLMSGTVPGNGTLATTVALSSDNFLIDSVSGKNQMTLHVSEFNANGGHQTEYTHTLPPNNGVTAMFELSTQNLVMAWPWSTTFRTGSINGRLVDKGFSTIGTFQANQNGAVESLTASSISVFLNDYFLVSWINFTNGVVARIYKDDGSLATTTRISALTSTTTQVSSAVAMLGSTSASTPSVSLSSNRVSTQTHGETTVKTSSTASRLMHPLQALFGWSIGRFLGRVEKWN